MNILILGAGNMASALASQFMRVGHAVQITSRTHSKAEAVARATGAEAVLPKNALEGNDVVVLATGYADAFLALRSLGTFGHQVLIDITNPLSDDYRRLTVGHSTSAAEEIARALPDAHVVKAFNTLFAQVIADGPSFANGEVAPVFYATDSARAKMTIRSLIDSIGFKPVDAGGLRNARYLEPLAGLNIYLGYVAEQGTSIAPTWIAKAA